MFKEICKCTLKHLRGTMTSGYLNSGHVYTSEAFYLSGNLDFYEAGFQTELCGKLTVAMTKKPSKSKVFANVGSRVYFRGVNHVQQKLDEVKSWMTSMSLLTRV